MLGLITSLIAFLFPRDGLGVPPLSGPLQRVSDERKQDPTPQNLPFPRRWEAAVQWQAAAAQSWLQLPPVIMA